MTRRGPSMALLLAAFLLIVLSGCASTSPRDLATRPQPTILTSWPGSLVPPLSERDHENVGRCLTTIRHTPDLMKLGLKLCRFKSAKSDLKRYRDECKWARMREPENLEIQQFEIDFGLFEVMCAQQDGVSASAETILGRAMYLYAHAWLSAQRTGQPIRPPDPRFAAIARERVKAELPRFIEWGRSLPFTDPEHVKVLLAAYMRCEEPQLTAHQVRLYLLPRVNRRWDWGVVTDGDFEPRAFAGLEALESRHRYECFTSVGLPAFPNYPPVHEMGWLVIAEQATSPASAPTQ